MNTQTIGIECPVHKHCTRYYTPENKVPHAFVGKCAPRKFQPSKKEGQNDTKEVVAHSNSLQDP